MYRLIAFFILISTRVFALECQAVSDPTFMCKSSEFQACEIAVKAWRANIVCIRPNRVGICPLFSPFTAPVVNRGRWLICCARIPNNPWS